MTKPRVWTVFLGLVLTIFAMIVVTGVVMVVTGDRTTSDARDGDSLIRGAAITGGVFLVMAFALSRRPWWARLRLGRAPGGGRTALLATIGLLALAQVIESLVKLLGLFGGSALAKFEQALAGMSGSRLWLAMLLIGPLAGLAEELLFRGYMQTRLAERWRPWTAVTVTAIFFGLAHLDPVHSVAAFFMGLWLGWITERVQSLWPAITAHAVNNTLATALAALKLTTDSTIPLLALGLVALLVLLVCIRRAAAMPPVASSAPLMTAAPLPG